MKHLGPRILSLVSLALLSPALTTGSVQAAPAWIARSIVLPRGEAAADLGLGIGRAPVGSNASVTGLGLNLGFSGGLTHDLELGFRTGLRFENEGKGTQADRYGRAWDTETYSFYGGGFETLANPELHARWLVGRGVATQLGLELRATLPIEEGTRFGVMVALPLTFHTASVRIDTGIYVPMIFYGPTLTSLTVPAQIWFQANSRLWLGPTLAVRMIRQGGAGYERFPVGFGLGYAFGPSLDFRSWLLFPDLSGDAAARTFGVGLAVQARFE